MKRIIAIIVVLVISITILVSCGAFSRSRSVEGKWVSQDLTSMVGINGMEFFDNGTVSINGTKNTAYEGAVGKYTMSDSTLLIDLLWITLNCSYEIKGNKLILVFDDRENIYTRTD